MIDLLRSRLARRAALLPCALACVLLASIASIARAQPIEEWRQVLSIPRIGARFTTFTVDPNNPRNLYLGTENSTVFVSNDGGRTWDERMLSPRQTQLRSTGSLRVPFVGPRPRPPVMLGNDYQTAELHLALPDVNVDPQSIGSISTGGFLGITQQSSPLSVGLIPYREDVLALALDPRNEELVPVVRIIVCEGSAFSVFVATNREVFGSPDGRYFYRVYAMNPGSVLIDGPGVNAVADVDCAPHDPNIVIVSTALGPSVSYDGGYTFSDDLPGVPGGSITTAAYDLAGARDGGEAALLLGAESYLYAGQLQGDGLQFVYPDPDEISTQPHYAIRSIITTDSGQIWLGTDFGIRASFDDGNTFDFPARHLFWATPISQVAAASYPGNRERIVVVKDDEIWATENSGGEWYPMFAGLSRRSIKRIETAPVNRRENKWWVLTSGELWESVTSLDATRRGRVSSEWQRTAQDKLEHLQPLDVVQDEILEALELDAASIESLMRKQRSSAFLPTLDLTGFWDSNVHTTSAVQMISYPLTRDITQNVAGFGFYLQATWHLPDTVHVDQTRSLSSLYQLRQASVYVVEDAWHEKWLLLDRLRRGVFDLVEAELLGERIEALDAVLDTWRE